MENFVELLIRIKGDRSTRQMARDTDVSASYITGLLQGKYVPTLQILNKLMKESQAPGVTLNQLINSTTNRNVYNSLYVLYMIGITGYHEIISVSDSWKTLSHKIDDVCRERHFTMIDDWNYITQLGIAGTFYIEKVEVI